MSHTKNTKSVITKSSIISKDSNTIQQGSSTSITHQITQKIFNQLQENQILRIKIRQYENYIKETKQNYEKLLMSQKNTVDLLAKEMKILEDQLNLNHSNNMELGKQPVSHLLESKQKIKEKASSHDKQNKMPSSFPFSLKKIQQQQKQQQPCSLFHPQKDSKDWKTQYAKLVTKIQTYVLNITKLIRKFTKQDQQSKKLIQKSNKQLQKSLKLHIKSQSLKSFTLEECQGNIQQARKLIQYLLGKNQQLQDRFQNSLIQLKQIKNDYLKKQEQNKQLNDDLSSLSSQHGQLRQQILIVLQSNQKLKQQIKYLKQKTIDQGKRITYLQKKLLYHESIQQLQKKRKKQMKCYTIQTEQFVDLQRIIIENDLKRIQQNLFKALKKIEELQNDNQQLLKFIDQCKNSKEQVLQKLKQYKVQHEKNQTQNQRLKKQNNQQRDKLIQQNKKIQKLQNTNKQLLSIKQDYIILRQQINKIDKEKQLIILQMYQKKQQFLEKQDYIKKLQELTNWKSNQCHIKCLQLEKINQVLKKQVLEKNQRICVLEEMLFKEFQDLKIQKMQNNQKYFKNNQKNMKSPIFKEKKLKKNNQEYLEKIQNYFQSSNSQKDYQYSQKVRDNQLQIQKNLFSMNSMSSGLLLSEKILNMKGLIIASPKNQNQKTKFELNLTGNNLSSPKLNHCYSNITNFTNFTKNQNNEFIQNLKQTSKYSNYPNYSQKNLHQNDFILVQQQNSNNNQLQSNHITKSHNKGNKFNLMNFQNKIMIQKSILKNRNKNFHNFNNTISGTISGTMDIQSFSFDDF